MQINLRDFLAASVAASRNATKLRTVKDDFVNGFSSMEGIVSVLQKLRLTKPPNQNHYARVPSQ
jgi:hypothetical protein